MLRQRKLVEEDGGQSKGVDKWRNCRKWKRGMKVEERWWRQEEVGVEEDGEVRGNELGEVEE